MRYIKDSLFSKKTFSLQKYSMTKKLNIAYKQAAFKTALKRVKRVEDNKEQKTSVMLVEIFPLKVV